MNYVEYGKENSDVIILLHGGGLSWWNYKEVAESLQTDYHVFLPILDGHAGCDKQFTTIENNASEIIEFINSKLGGSVLMIGGLSLGGQILLEILSQCKNICKYAIVESALVIPSKFTYSMIKPAFGSCYGLIKYKWFSKLQFKSLRIKPDLFDEYYKDTCAISKSDMIAFLQENSVYSLKDGIGECETTVQIYVGEKENHSMKKSAKIIHEKLQGSFIQVLPNMYHGEFSINHADDYVRKLLEIVKQARGIKSMREDIIIRQESAKDYKEIVSLILRSFKEGTNYSDGSDIIALIEEIRVSEYYIPELSFVAELDGKIVGHFLFSKFPLSPNADGGHGDDSDIVMLAPVSVHADYFHQHIGVTMLTLGIKKVREMGYKGITVEGDYNFYNRVGFRTSSEYGIYPTSGYPMTEPRCMMCQETEEGSLKGYGGYVVYDMYYNA